MSNLKPGRELDVLIAEKVMGWEVGGYPLGRGKNIPKMMRPAYPTDSEDVPRYSTDIAAAWQVVEKLALLPWSENYADSPGIDIRLTRSHERGEWECRAENEEFVRERAATAPHAICLTALQAVGCE